MISSEDRERLPHLDEEGRPKIIEHIFVVEDHTPRMRVDLYLRRKIRRLSRTRLQEIIRTQLEGPDGRRLKPHSLVGPGDRLVIRRPARPEPPAPRTFGVLYAEGNVLVVDKPAGLVMHASARFYFNTLTRLLSERFPGEDLQIAHRIDRETSGCVVVARGRLAASRLKGAFAGRRVKKTYLAIVHGTPPWPDDAPHVIDLPLRLAGLEESQLKIRMVPAPGDPGALSARTDVTVVARHPGATLLSCAPVTGRQHQIRAHLAAAGHPIVGDKLYAHGDEAFARFYQRETDGTLTPAELEEEFGMARQALHAHSITFPHPDSGCAITVQSPIPADFHAYLNRCSD